jgi:NADP-reducing hydrogenase subunit HndB
MARITSPDALKSLREKVQKEIDLRTGAKDIRITVHMGTCGIAAGARDVLTQLATELSGESIDNVTLRQSGCAGLCDQEPMMTLSDKEGRDFRYGKLDKNKVREIIEGHVQGGNPVTKYLINA